MAEIICNSYYRIFGKVVCIQTTDPIVNRYCDFILQEFSCEASTCNSYIKMLPHSNNDFLIVMNDEIRKLEVFSKIWGKKEISVFEYISTPKVLTFFAVQHVLTDIEDLYKFHSCAVSKCNKGIFIIGPSGSGKSTFTLELVANNFWQYLADEYGLLTPSLEILPFYKAVSFSHGIIELDNHWERWQFGIESHTIVPNSKIGKSVPLRAIIFIKYSPENDLKLTQIKKSEGLIKLFNSQIFHSKHLASLDQIAEVAKKVNIYELEHNESKRAAKVVENLINVE